jgi:hypothetical protein
LTISGASSVNRRTWLTYVAFTPFARAKSSSVPCTPSSSIFLHRNARASALTMALSTRGRGAQGAPSGVTTNFRPPRFRNVSRMWTRVAPTRSSQGFRNASSPGGSAEGRYVKWHTIADQQRAVIEDVTRIRHHPLVDPVVPVYGYVYDVKTGRLNEVAAASQAGRPLS